MRFTPFVAAVSAAYAQQFGRALETYQTTIVDGVSAMGRGH